MNDIEISCNKKGFGTILIDGMDISKHVTQAHVIIEPSRPTILELSLSGPIKVKTKGNVVTFKEDK
jgi:hypothetical protein